MSWAMPCGPIAERENQGDYATPAGMRLPQRSLAAGTLAVAAGVSRHILSFVNIWRHNMNKLLTAVTLSALVAGPALVQSANAQRLDPARERVIRECMAMQNRDSHDGYEGKKGGGIQWTYRACMTDHGEQP
jgi:hypothetical protein